MGESKANLNITLIGAGNLATNLGLALYRAGHKIVCVYSHTEKSARQLAEKLDCSWTTDLAVTAEKAAQSTCCIIAVTDSVLADVASKLSDNEHTLFLHTAGSIQLDVLPQAHRGVFYPMQTFSIDREVDFSRIPTFLETACPEDHDTLQILAESITDNIYWLNSDQRKSLHLAAVFACNFANYCYDASSQILEHEGIPFSVMLPLIEETTAKLHQLSPYEAQTGPAIRNDKNVLERHMSMLADQTDLRKIYQELSEQIHKRHVDHQQKTLSSQ